MVNFNLPDSHGIETFERRFRPAPKIPILILVDTDTEQTATLALAPNCIVIRRDGFEFLPIADEIEGDRPGAVAVGRWVLREACCQMRAWQLEGLAPRCISIKIAALKLPASGFVAGVRAVLAETGLKSRYLELEMPRTLQIGDTRLMQDSRSVGDVIEELRELGALSALVDFRTAYSNSNDSKGFPIDTLKIDQSLVSGRVRSEDGIDILGGLIGAGNCPHVRVVAKGVENARPN